MAALCTEGGPEGCTEDRVEGCTVYPQAPLVQSFPPRFQYRAHPLFHYRALLLPQILSYQPRKYQREGLLHKSSYNLQKKIGQCRLLAELPP